MSMIDVMHDIFYEFANECNEFLRRMLLFDPLCEVFFEMLLLNRLEFASKETLFLFFSLQLVCGDNSNLFDYC